MALTANDYIRPVGMIGGGSVPVLEVKKATGTTWSQGDVVVAASGLAVEGANDLLSYTLLGIAAEDAVSGKLTANIYPALPNVIFWARIANDDAGATVALAASHRYTSSTGAFELSTESTTWFINVGETDTGYELAMIIDLVDAVGTAWGAVHFVFIKSAFIPTT